MPLALPFEAVPGRTADLDSDADAGMGLPVALLQRAYQRSKSSPPQQATMHEVLSQALPRSSLLSQVTP